MKCCIAADRHLPLPDLRSHILLEESCFQLTLISVAPWIPLSGQTAMEKAARGIIGRPKKKRATSPERLWEEEGVTDWLGNTGILGLDTVGRKHGGWNLNLGLCLISMEEKLQNKTYKSPAPCPLYGSFVFCAGIKHRQIDQVPPCCNYALLINAVSHCAVSLGLALTVVLLSIL